MIQVIRAEQEDDLRKAFSIRERVFVHEQQVPPDAEHDEHEPVAKHYLATFDGEPCGAARWRKTDAGVKLERFAVLPEFRNKKVGEQVLKVVLEDVKQAHPQEKVYLNAQLPAVNFYKRNGFAAEGDLFVECDIEHYKMSYKS